MRILFTNNTLDKPAGTELSLRDAATRLNYRGHDVVCYSRQHGEVADSLKELGILVVAELSEIPVGWEPEIVHGHHEWETSIAALKFPTSPIISFCRGVHAWQEAPCTAPNVVKYAVVDTGCRDRLLHEEHIPEQEIEMILNGVDLKRFPERETYRKKIEKVLVFSNYAKEDNYYGIIKQACEAEGVSCEAIGDGVGNNVSNPLPYLQNADLVFAKGKAALEAAMTGAMVVVCDEPGVAADYVKPENFTEMRELSFGYPIMTEKHDFETYRNRIRGYNTKTAQRVSQLAREAGDIERTVDQLEALYTSVSEKWELGHGSDLADFDTFSQWASAFFEKQTWPYKLGRESQEIWRNVGTLDVKHQSRYAEPFTPEGEKIEAHRVMDTLRKNYALKQRLKAAEKELARIGKHAEDKGGKKGWFSSGKRK